MGEHGCARVCRAAHGRTRLCTALHSRTRACRVTAHACAAPAPHPDPPGPPPCVVPLHELLSTAARHAPLRLGDPSWLRPRPCQRLRSEPSRVAPGSGCRRGWHWVGGIRPSPASPSCRVPSAGAVSGHHGAGGRQSRAPCQAAPRGLASTATWCRRDGGGGADGTGVATPPRINLCRRSGPRGGGNGAGKTGNLCPAPAAEGRGWQGTGGGRQRGSGPPAPRHPARQHDPAPTPSRITP